ncbi:MAG TPA: D-alanyl-D-alanine carboxypeptidase/D-alanyl-D-alanine-endopeptidase [Thermoanaerobaculia bacterium]|nr:D-alanyl-D-alanine carboxypeptidase/D-alanyl-D-alanine-endopeptidase [Thermoanaerobaculia bacterium]
MRLRSKSFLSLSLLLTAACATTLPTRIEQAAAVPQLRNAIWGIDVQDDSGRVLFQRNAHTLLMPASNRKLFAAATAITCHGLDHRFATELWLDGNDLVIRGTGDSSLGGRWAFDRDAVFATFVDALRARDIRAVDNVIADASAFDRVTIPGSWKVGNLGNDYAAPVDALAYNENVVGVVIEHCEQPIATTDPAFVRVIANITCGEGEPTVTVDALNSVHVQGKAPPRFTALPSIHDPALYAAQAFADTLRQAGIDVRGDVIAGRPSGLHERLAVIESPPLSLLLTVMLKNSQNLYAEMLFKSTAGTYGGAEDLEREFLTREVGIDGTEFRFVDGSGLSPDDLATPSAIVSLLRWMNAPAHRGVFWSILATPGEEGTLRRRLLPLASRLRGKTGTIAGVNALSGILAGTHGGYRYFSIVINHHIADSPVATRAIDAIVNAIADF